MQKIFKLVREKFRKEPKFNFSENELKALWPSHPREERVPSFAQIIEADGPISKHLKCLKKNLVEIAGEDGRIEEQMFFNGRFGQVCLPALIEKEKGFIIATAHAGAWTPEAQQDYLQWLVRVRACDFIHSLKIVMASEEEFPVHLQEASLRRRECLMLINIYPYIDLEGHDKNAEVFIDAAKYHYPKWEHLSFDEKGLELLHAFIVKEFSEIKEGGFFFPFLVKIIGALLGEVCVQTLNGKWQKEESGWDIITFSEEDKDFKPFPVFSWAVSYLRNPQETARPGEVFRNLKKQLAK